jgi:hypothetical protein
VKFDMEIINMCIHYAQYSQYAKKQLQNSDKAHFDIVSNEAELQPTRHVLTQLVLLKNVALYGAETWTLRKVDQKCGAGEGWRISVGPIV